MSANARAAGGGFGPGPLRAMLGRIPCLARHLSASTITSLVHAGVVVQFPAACAVTVQGVPAGDVSIVLTGRCTVFTDDPGGKLVQFNVRTPAGPMLSCQRNVVTLGYVSAGHCIGVAAAASGAPETCTVVAECKTDVLVVPGTAASRLLHRRLMADIATEQRLPMPSLRLGGCAVERPDVAVPPVLGAAASPVRLAGMQRIAVPTKFTVQRARARARRRPLSRPHSLAPLPQASATAATPLATTCASGARSSAVCCRGGRQTRTRATSGCRNCRPCRRSVCCPRRAAPTRRARCGAPRLRIRKPRPSQSTSCASTTRACGGWPPPPPRLGPHSAQTSPRWC